MKSSLIAIQKRKKVTTTTLNSWEDLFSNATIMTIIIPNLHLFDVINIARTNRHLYRFYYGDTPLSKLLREIVLRDIDCKYKKKHPLRYLGKTRNTKESAYRDRFVYIANCCSGCSKHLRLSNGYNGFSKHVFCYHCQVCYSEFFHTVYKAIESKCKEIYSEDCLPRITRYLKRYAIHHGLVLKGLIGPSHRNEIDRLIILFSIRISNLDISRRFVFNIFQPILIKPEIKVIKAVKRERDEGGKQILDQRSLKFSHHLYDIESSIWNGDLSFSDFIDSPPLSDLFNFV